MPSSVSQSAEETALFGHEDKKHDRLLEIALHHANLIQARKDAEAHILDSLEILIDFPTSSSSKDDDARALSQHMRLFRPSDLDDLIVERNIIDKCGYPLCGNSNRKQPGSAKYRIVRNRKQSASGSGIVDAAELGKWCSQDCRLKARHLRAQLSEEPSWTRHEQGKVDLVLPPANVDVSIVEAMEGLQLKEERTVSKEQALAVERGDATKPARAENLMSIEEHGFPAEPTAPHDFQAMGAHDEIEGHKVGQIGRR